MGCKHEIEGEGGDCSGPAENVLITEQGDSDDMRCMPDGDDFKEVVGGEGYFVDKSLLIDRILQDTQVKVFLYTRPRRFGKSTNLSMIDAYFNRNYAGNSWFDGLKISDARPDDPLKNSFSVIHLNLKDMGAGSEAEFTDDISRNIADTYRSFRYLLESEALDSNDRDLFNATIRKEIAGAELKTSLKRLTEFLCEHHGTKTLVLVDEYDRAINMSHGQDQQMGILKLTRDILSPALKSNESVRFAVMTGVLQIAKEGFLSGLNNLSVDNILSTGSSEMFGFTESEVREILDYYGRPDRFGEARDWYDGYRFGDSEVYNPYSIARYVKSGFVPKDSFWVNSGNSAVLDSILSRSGPDIYRELTTMASGGTVEADVVPEITIEEAFSGRDALYSIMAMSGYVSARSLSVGGTLCELSIPNREIRSVFMKKVLGWRSATGDAYALVRSTLDGDVEGMEKGLQWFLDPVRFLDLSNEGQYMMALYGLYCALCPEHRVVPDGMSGNGYSDLRFERVRGPEPNIVMELKRVPPDGHSGREDLLEAVDDALEQIRRKDYTRMLEGRTLVYGVAFSGKDVAVRLDNQDARRLSPSPS